MPAQRSPDAADERVLVLMPTVRDGERTARLLRQEINVSSVLCADMAQLCGELRRGAGAVLLTDDVVLSESSKSLAEVLREQPPWSAVPILLLAREGASERFLFPDSDALRAVTVVERPVRTRALFSAVLSALRARRSQYQIRDALLERERQGAKLAAQDENLRFALSAGSLGAWELDLANDELQCSDICKAIFGRPAEAPFSYGELRDSVHRDDQTRVRSALAHSLETGGLYDVQHRVVWPNGETRWVMVRGRAIYSAAGQPVRMVGVALDVTERELLLQALRQSEAELARQAEQLRTADRLKDEFLATLAHELRNPLAPVTAGMTLLSEAPIGEATRTTLGVMQRQIAHMVRLIDDLLDVSRITRGKLELKRERVSLASVIDAAVEASQSAIQRAQHTLHVKAADEPLYLDADPTRIAQVISNLLNNSSKYMVPGGVIELAARRDADWAVITVSDEGSGIPADHLEDVFEMFSQVNRALERSQGGLGIGLALVRRLVEMHGGSVTAQSPGSEQGSTFTVRLPLAASSAVSAAAPAEKCLVDARPLAGKRILIVDDNDDAAQMLSLMLVRSGCATTTAHDGAEGLRSARELLPHAVILDIGLPDISGYEVALRMRQDSQLAHTVLIALTGWGTEEDKRRASSAGFDTHITKPVNADELRGTLARLLQPSLEQTG